jgi:deoxyadenosine/deoxycytidine kinase
VARARYIAIEGPPGVGKTALACRLAEHLGARCVVEPDTNPFVIDQRKSQFQSRLYQLLSRFNLNRELHQEDLFAQGGVVSDYLFLCDRLLAQLHLGRDELLLYDKVYGLLGREAPRADLVVYLQASPTVLLDRLRRRSSSERLPSREELDRVAQAYAEFFFDYGESALLVVNTSEIDFVSNQADLDQLTAVIQKTRSGLSHYSPLGSR